MGLDTPQPSKEQRKEDDPKRRARTRKARLGAQDAPSILIDSAEGAATFPGLNGDLESRGARAFIHRRLAEIPKQRQDRKDPGPA